MKLSHLALAFLFITQLNPAHAHDFETYGIIGDAKLAQAYEIDEAQCYKIVENECVPTRLLDGICKPNFDTLEECKNALHSKTSDGQGPRIPGPGSLQD